jgi:Domain of unknown function (DUF4390)
MMDSSTPCCKSIVELLKFGLLHVLWVIFLFWAMAMPAQAQNNTEVSNLRVEQATEGMFLSATLRFELPPAIEDALLKGIPMTFLMEAQVLRDRWYWYDKSVTSASRSIRLAYQPLTRRWRLSANQGAADAAGGVNLSQNFDQLADALAAVRRISRWKIADSSEIDVESRHNVEFRFRLDTTQLPRPMQIGITGNSDWTISVQRNVRPEPR